MAEIWYMSVDAESIDEAELKHEKPIAECIELLEIIPEKWVCDTESTPQLKTGDDFFDGSGYIFVLMKVDSDEILTLGDDGWKPGWYSSSVSIVGLEKKLRTKPK